MSGGGAPPPAPLFIEADGRRIFALHHAAADEPQGSILMLPPFAEEQNMSRRMAYLTGRACAAAGFDFLLPDLTGTGESDGDFADARWETWRDDALAAWRWLAEKTGTAPALLGLRAGALLALDIFRDTGASRLVLWQPVGSGQTMLTQFLRIRVAAGLTGGEKETTKALREAWAAGCSVEVAGYEVHPELAAAIDGLSLAAKPPPAGTRVDWCEIGNAERGLSPASERSLDAWKQAGVEASPHICPGESFWTIQETTVAPALIERTIALLSGTEARA